MKNKKVIVSIIAATAAAVGAVGAPIEVESKVWSKYIDQNGAAYHDKPVVQTTLSGELPEGFYWEVLHSAGLDDGDLSSNFGDEIDVTVGKSFAVSESIAFDASVAYWDTVDLLSAKPADTVVAAAELAFAPSDAFNVSLCLERYLSTDESVYPGGSRASLRASFSKELREGLSLSLEPGVFYDSGAFGYEKAWIAAVEGSLSWRLGDRATLVLPAVSATRMLSTVSDRDKTEVAWGGGLSFSF